MRKDDREKLEIGEEVKKEKSNNKDKMAEEDNRSNVEFSDRTI